MRGLCGIYARHTIRTNTGSRVLFEGSAYESPTTSLSSVGSRRTTSRKYRLADRTLERTDVMPFGGRFNRRSVPSTLQAEHTGNAMARRGDKPKPGCRCAHPGLYGVVVVKGND